jgi:hypothetical protein
MGGTSGKSEANRVWRSARSESQQVSPRRHGAPTTATPTFVSQCANIDFKTAFSISVPGRNGVPVTGILRLTEEQCDFCKMIKSMLDAVDRPTNKPQRRRLPPPGHSASTVLKLRLSNLWTTTAMDNALVVIQDRPVAKAVRVAVRRRGVILGTVLPVPTEPMMGNASSKVAEPSRRTPIDYSLLRGWIDDCQTSNKNPTTSAIS